MFRKLLIFTAPLLLSIPASAGLITFSLAQSVKSSPPGGVYQPAACQNLDGSGACVIFSGTIVFDQSDLYSLTGLQVTMDPSNPDAGADVFDNNNENYFFDNVPGTMGEAPASNTYAGGIFEVDVDPATPNGDYFGTATLQYQDSSGNPFSSSPVNFEIVVPEPGMFTLGSAGLLALAVLRKRKTRAFPYKT
jgi:hypothetical protein